MNEDQERKIMYGLLALLTIAIIATALIFYKPAEPYTILYFTDPLQIKTNVSVNDPFNVNFTVENHEKTNTGYSYFIELIYYDNQTVVKTTNISIGDITLNDNETATISEKVVIGEPYEDRIMVLVRLYKEGIDGTYRSLRYWIHIK